MYNILFSGSLSCNLLMTLCLPNPQLRRSLLKQDLKGRVGPLLFYGRWVLLVQAPRFLLGMEVV